MLHTTTPAPVTAPPAQYLQFSPPRESTALSHPATVLRLLQECAFAGSELTLRLERDSRLYILRGTIRNVDGSGALLYRMQPQNWRELLAEPAEVEASYWLPSGLFRFRTWLRPFEAGPVSPYAVLALPNAIFHKQARHSYRVNLPPRSSQVLLPLQDAVLSGYCLNLSLEGCCCIFREVIAAHFAIDDTIGNLSISLNELLTFDTSATIRRIETLDTGNTRLGLRLEPLLPLQQRQLEAALTTLQRDWLRRQTRPK